MLFLWYNHSVNSPFQSKEANQSKLDADEVVLPKTNEKKIEEEKAKAKDLEEKNQEQVQDLDEQTSISKNNLSTPNITNDLEGSFAASITSVLDLNITPQTAETVVTKTTEENQIKNTASHTVIEQFLEEQRKAERQLQIEVPPERTKHDSIKEVQDAPQPKAAPKNSVHEPSVFKESSHIKETTSQNVPLTEVEKVFTPNKFVQEGTPTASPIPSPETFLKKEPQAKNSDSTPEFKQSNSQPVLEKPLDIRTEPTVRSSEFKSQPVSNEAQIRTPTSIEQPASNIREAANPREHNSEKQFEIPRPQIINPEKVLADKINPEKILADKIISERANPEKINLDKPIIEKSIADKVPTAKLVDTSNNLDKQSIKEVQNLNASKTIEPKVELPRLDPKRSENQQRDVTLIKDLANIVTSKNAEQIIKTMTKEDLKLAIEVAIKKASSEGNISEIQKIVKALINEPVIKEAIRVIVSQSSGDNTDSIKKLNIPEIGKNIIKSQLPVEKAIRVEDISKAITTKEEALKVLVGIIVDSEKVNHRLVQEVKAETFSKITQIQSTVDELIKLRVEQFVALTTKGYGVDGTTFRALCHEALNELATRYGLNDQQRAFLAQILIHISQTDFDTGESTKQKTPDKSKELPKKQIKEPIRELSKEELEKLFNKEIELLESMLKENVDIKKKKAEEKLAQLLEELIDDSMSYEIDEDLEVITTYTISGIVLDQETTLPISGALVYAGMLGTYQTNSDGVFKISNVPEDTVYMIGLDKIGYIFVPSYQSGTLNMSVNLLYYGLAIN